MNSIFLILIIIGISAQHIAKKMCSGDIYIFSSASALCATVFVFLLSDKFTFSPEILLYSVLFAISYGMALVFSVLAIKSGPLSLTCLVTQYSLIIPTFCGLIFLGEPKKSALYIGIVLILISLILVNIEKKDEKKISLKWAVFAFLAFFGNGVCSTVQKIAGINLAQKNQSAFMTVALLLVSVSFFIMALIAKDKIAFSLKKDFASFIINGSANGLVNFLVLYLSSRISASFMFPIIAAGGIIATALVSTFIYHERLSLFQKVGFATGIASIIFLNL